MTLTKTFTTIPTGDTDPDSPITTGLMVAMVDNMEHLEEWMGGASALVDRTADHTHAGVGVDGTTGVLLTAGTGPLPSNSVVAATIATDAVGSAEIAEGAETQIQDFNGINSNGTFSGEETFPLVEIFDKGFVPSTKLTVDNIGGAHFGQVDLTQCDFSGEDTAYGPGGSADSGFNLRMFFEIVTSGVGGAGSADIHAHARIEFITTGT